MSQPTGVGIRLKLARASFHAEALNIEIVEFRKAHANAIVGEVHDDGKTHVYRPEYVPELPAHWALAAGDSLHNMRAALDHLAWQLVIASGRAPATSTAFPISLLSGKAGIEPGTLEDIRREVEAVQPYHASHDPDRHWLSVLKKLDNIDKHRTLVVVISALDGIGQRGDEVGTVKLLERVLKVGKPVAKISYRISNLELNKYVRPFMGVAFGEPPIEKVGVPFALDSILRHIENEVLPRFRPFIPDL